MYLVDTNVVSELPRRKPDPGVIAWLAAQSSLAISAITVEELAFGVERARPEQAERLGRWFAALMKVPPVIVVVDERIAHLAGRLRASREKAGQVLAQADLLIAASAASTGRILVTRNVRHFKSCGVPLLNPFTSSAV